MGWPLWLRWCSVAKALGIIWKLHTTYCPPKKEHMNRTLKLQLGKLCQETHLQWGQLLSVALLRIRSGLAKWTGLSLFEILFGHPSPLIKGLQGDLKEIGNLTLRQQMQALGLTLSKIND
jgi:hypothetical protein